MSASILVIDDNLDDQALYRRALKDFDYALVLATSAQAALACLAESAPDLILLDYYLPDMDGLAFMKQLAAYPDMKIPVVMLTGAGNEAVAVEAMKHGAADYLVKDVEGQYLRLLPGVVESVLAAQAQREQARQLRQQAEALLMQHKRVVEASIDGFWMIDLDGRLIEVNPAYAGMVGYTREELVGMHISQLSRRGPEKVKATLEQVIATGSSRFETQHRCKDGSIIDLDASVTYLAEAKRLFAFLRDITERKKTEQAMRLCAITFEARDAILITDASANIIRVNRAFTEITGYAPEDVLGKNPRMLSAGRQDKAFYTEMWRHLIYTGSWAGEIWDKRKNGEVYPKWLTITAIKNERQETTQYVGMFSDITERKKAEEEIRNLAFYDVLTRLPNRRLFLDRFRAALSVSVRRNDYGAVLFIDLDRFKALNDTLGHDYGDMLLVEVAARIKSGVREMDTVARLGGDEFVVLIEGLGGNKEEAAYKAGEIAEKIRGALARPYQLKQHKHHTSPSIGVSLYHGNTEPVEALLRHADMAMYQAKEAGRNVVRFFDFSMQHDVEEHAALENDLRLALKQGQLHLHYQVQVDNDHRPVGAEALLRWMHPQRGLVMPDQFIPLAEKSGLILEIGQWVLETACRQLVAWGANEQARSLTLAVNISPRQFTQQEFVSTVAAMLRTHEFDPARLKLELTESIVLDDLEGTMAKMRALRALGVSLSMDDFGTRYSSLSYLNQLPLDQLKLDRDFVQAVTREGSDALLVQNIINLATHSGLDVIAEGVENEEQLFLLKHRDCIAYQGFLFSKAVPLGEFEALLEREGDSNSTLGE